MHQDRPNIARNGFTVIELIIVIAVMAILAGMLIPALGVAKHRAREVICASNLKQIGYAMAIYADNHNDFYPVEPTEHNPHPGLFQALVPYGVEGLYNAFYCPQAEFMESSAASPDYNPQGETDSVMDTPENRAAGNISYIYWSFYRNKPKWRNAPFFPRVLRAGRVVNNAPNITYLTTPDKQTGLMQTDFVKQAEGVPPSQVWVLSDFFRMGAPNPHVRMHAGGLNVLFLDGHVDLVLGRPRDNYQ